MNYTLILNTSLIYNVIRHKIVNDFQSYYRLIVLLKLDWLELGRVFPLVEFLPKCFLRYFVHQKEDTMRSWTRHQSWRHVVQHVTETPYNIQLSIY